MSTKLQTIFYWSLAGLPFTLTQKTSRFMHLDATAFTSFFLCEPLTVCWRPALAGNGSAIAPMPCHTTMLPGYYRARSLSASPPRSPCGASAMQTYISTRVKPVPTPRHVFYLPGSWYPWIPGQVSVYVVGRVWHQPNFALAARGGCIYSAGIVHERCHACARRFLLFCAHLFETGIWVVRAEKGHDGDASCCRGKRYF